MLPIYAAPLRLSTSGRKAPGESGRCSRERRSRKGNSGEPLKVLARPLDAFPVRFALPCALLLAVTACERAALKATATRPDSLPAQIAPTLDRRTEGLKLVRRGPDHAVVDLDNRFQAVSVVESLPDGTHKVGCVTTPAEAEAFFTPDPR